MPTIEAALPTIEEQVAPRDPIHAGRFGEGSPPDLRARTARGTIINGLFLVGTSAISLVQGVTLARLLPTATFGLWGLLMAGFMTLLLLGSVGIDDKFIQQDERDQQRAFEVAFTLQMVLGGVFVVVILLGMPAFALIYGRPELILPGASLALVIPALALQMPLWIHYRRMDFVRQRKLQLVDPVVTFVATIGLALGGLGLWALVLGAMIGSGAASVVIVRTSPYPLRFRWDRAALREYTRFSWPLFVGAISTVLLIQVPVVVSSRVLGVTAIAGITLATSIAQFTTRVDDVVTQTLYPAICAVKDRSDLLFESFWKSNRLALLWAAPLGAAAPLFAGDFVHYVIGEKWRFAVPLIGVFGLNAALNQIGFNWSAFFRARGETRPMAIGGVVGMISVLVIAVPLLVTKGLTGFGVGMTIVTLIALSTRMWFLRRIFPGLPLVRHTARGLGPAVAAAASVLAVRLLAPGPRSLTRITLESVLFGAVALAATLTSERALLRESVGYLRRTRSAPAPG